MMTPEALLLLNAASTLMLAGLIWMVQRVHYPAFNYVSPPGFAEFEAFHQRRISSIVVPLMLIELVTAAGLILVRPASIPLWWALAGAVLVIAIWVDTFAVQVPLHRQLSRGYSASTLARLVRTNWLRTGLWSLRGILVLWGLWTVLGARGNGL